MKIYTDFFQEHIEKGTAVTIGKFDGFHRGHKKLLDLIKNEKKLESLVVTFSTSPRVILSDAENKNLCTDNERRLILENEKIDDLLECSFDKRFSETEPEEFIRILLSNYSMKFLAVGSDFTFGRCGAGNTELLKKLSNKYSFKLLVIDKIKDMGRDISSSFIREKIKAGDVEAAEELLGYPYFIVGKIVHGRHLGTSMGIPTINLFPPLDKLLPPKGVYFTRTEIDGKIIDGVTNIGVRPTVDSSGKLTVETNLLYEGGDLYGETAIVRFYHYERPEQKFSSIDELKNRIEMDRKEALAFFQNLSLQD